MSFLILSSAGAGTAPAQAVGSINTPGSSGSTPVTASTAYMSIPRTGNTDVGAAGTAFTVEFWIRPSSTANDNAFGTVTQGANYSGTDSNIIWDCDDFTEARGFIIGISAGQVYFSLNTSLGQRTIVGGPDLRDGAWHSVMAVRESDNTVHVYSDGTRRDTAAGPSGNVDYSGTGTDNDEHLHIIGKEKLNVGGGFNGDISMARVSNSARQTGTSYTPATSALSNDANTVFLAYFDENADTTVGDSSDENNDGTLLGSPVPTWSTDDPF